MKNKRDNRAVENVSPKHLTYFHMSPAEFLGGF